MSQVIQNHVLRVGQTVCVSSQEESKSLHPAGYPGCSTLPMKYTYYSTEGWADPSAMVHPNTRLLPSRGLYRAHPVFEHVAAHAQGNGQQDSSLERPTAPYQPREEEEEDTSTDPEAHLVSPTLDISIESLNQLILEIDPTFQPLMCKPVKSELQPASQDDAAATKKEDPEAIGEAEGAGGPSAVQTSCKPQRKSPGRRGWPRTILHGQDEVLCLCEGLEMGTDDVPHRPQWDQCGVLPAGIRVSHKGAGPCVYPGSAQLTCSGGPSWTT